MSRTTRTRAARRSIDRCRRTACPRTLLAVLACLVISSVGCRDPYAEVRAELSPADRDRFDQGARVAAPCAACHDLAFDAMKIGPHLRGIDGRRVGSVAGFGYSTSLQGNERVWNARLLEAFLAEPQRVFPGNRMMSPGVRDPSARADLVFFLIHAGGIPTR